jgi:hypothetical protein
MIRGGREGVTPAAAGEERRRGTADSAGVGWRGAEERGGWEE